MGKQEQYFEDKMYTTIMKIYVLNFETSFNNGTIKQCFNLGFKNKKQVYSTRSKCIAQGASV